MGQFEIVSRCRHVRYVFFIDTTYEYQAVHSLMLENQSMWGGRYNPIIPVNDNTISEAYLKLLKFFDPDFVVYSKGVNPQIIVESCGFNPIDYLPIEEYKLRGIERNSVTSKYGELEKDFAGRELVPVVYPEGLENDQSTLDFLRLNIGATTMTWANIWDALYGSKAGYITLQPEKKNLWFGWLLESNHFDSSDKYSVKVDTVRAKCKKQTSYEVLEFVVAKNTSSFLDLLYYWNRFLFESTPIRYATIDQLHHLLLDANFQSWVRKSSAIKSIEFVSTSLSQSELSHLLSGRIQMLQKLVQICLRHEDGFPYDVIGFEPTAHPMFREAPSTQLLVNNTVRYQIPKLDFQAHGEYMVDLEISRFNSVEIKRNLIMNNQGGDCQNEILYPNTTSVKSIFPDYLGRVSTDRNISVLFGEVRDNSKTTRMSIPEFSGLLKQLIISPSIHGNKPEQTIVDIGNSDDSNKLSAFMQSFDEFESIRNFLYDKFWTDIFDELAISEKATGNVLVFDTLIQKARQLLTRQGINLVENEGNYRTLNNLNRGMKSALETLCDFRVFFKGIVIKCHACSSSHWYALDDVGESFRCDGCRQYLKVPVEPTFGYKLSNLIRNNLVNGNGGSGGNLTVIKSLLYLEGRSKRSFEYHPQIDLYDDELSNKPIGDLDIVCLSDGKLVIGEAKHSSSEFKKEQNKCLKFLAKVCKEVRPDEVILSCSKDVNDGLRKAKMSLEGCFHKWPLAPKITTLIVEEPIEYYNGDHGFFDY